MLIDMPYQIISMVLDLVVGVIGGACLLRLYMQQQRIPMSARAGNPIGPFLFAVSDWIVLPLRRALSSARVGLRVLLRLHSPYAVARYSGVRCDVSARRAIG